MRVDRPDWKGRTVVCVASGPSLTAEDCELVRATGHPTIVTNTTYRLCPWADVLFGFDAKWWQFHHRELAGFQGKKVSVASSAKQWGVQNTHGQDWFKGIGNSGACAIGFALAGKPDRVILLGFDCQKTGGRSHWHGDHMLGMSNCASIKSWPSQFAQVAAVARMQGVPVLNASRQTALTCFARADLSEVLK